MTANFQFENTPAGRWSGLVDQAVSAAGLELVKSELLGAGGSRILRVYVDQPGGVSLEDCERASRAISSLLDQDEGAVPGRYTLEVSSPGLDRPLVRLEDFDRFSGQRVRLQTRQPVGGARHWTGVLQGRDAEGVQLLLSAGKSIRIEWTDLSSARLAPEWPQPVSRGRRGRQSRA